MAIISSNIIGSIDPSTDIIVIGGRTMTGLATDNAVEITPSEQNQIAYKGMNNTISLAQVRDTSGTLTLRLVETSEDNTWMWALLAAIKTGKVSTIPYLIKRGNVDFYLGDFWIENPPTNVLGREVNEREWVLGITNAHPNITDFGVDIAGALGGSSADVQASTGGTA